MGSNTEPSTLHEVGQQSDTAAVLPERYSNTSPDSSDAASVQWQRFHANALRHSWTVRGGDDVLPRFKLLDYM